MSGHKPNNPNTADASSLQVILSAGIKGYRYAISPLLGCNCRFYPSCSEYALQALESHGAAKGTYLAVRRLLKCHPFHPGGFDPVPDNAVDHCKQVTQ